MVYLQDIFDELTYGEFSNMAVGQSVNGSIKVTEYPRLVSIINSALRELHIRFSLQRREFSLYQQAGVSTYHIDSIHDGTPSTSADPEIYLEGIGDILNSGVRIVKITDAFDASDDSRIRINDKNYPDDIFMPNYSTIKFTPVDGEDLKVANMVFQSTHVPLALSEGFNPSVVTIDIPQFIIQPIIPFIVAKWFKGKTSKKNEGEDNITKTFMYQFERECKLISDRNLITDEIPEDSTFTDDGWA